MNLLEVHDYGFVDEINPRLENATPKELERMREFLKLSPSANIDDIIKEYRSAAGNSIVNLARRFDWANTISYREILVDVIEKIRPVDDDFQGYLQKVKFIFKRDDPLEETFSSLPTEELELVLLEIANKKIADAQKNMSSDDEKKWRSKAKKEIAATSTNGANKPALLNSYADATNIFGSMFSMAVSRGVFIVAGGTVAAVASAILIPAVFSGPAYRKTVNATLELIMIGRRQAAEAEEIEL